MPRNTISVYVCVYIYILVKNDLDMMWKDAVMMYY
jgi:hypothetical protein